MECLAYTHVYSHLRSIVITCITCIVFGSENYIGNVTIFEEESLINNSDGLYLLDRCVKEEGKLKSFELLGRVPSQSNEEVGVFLFVLRKKEKKLHVKKIFKVGYRDNNIITPGEIILISKTNNFKIKLTKGDYIGLYLPKIGDSALQIQTNKSGAKFAHLEGSGSENIKKSWSELKELKPEVEKLINGRKWSQWKTIEGNLNFKVTIKLGECIHSSNSLI